MKILAEDVQVDFGKIENSKEDIKLPTELFDDREDFNDNFESIPSPSNLKEPTNLE